MDIKKDVIGIVGGMGSYATLNIFKRILDSFEAEKEYRMEDDLGGDITIIPTFMPTIERKVAQRTEASDVKLKLNARGKIILSVFSVIAVLLVSFCVYNAVRISSLNSMLADRQSQAQMINREVYLANSEYNEIIMGKDYTYYLYVDAISYYNTVNIFCQLILVSKLTNKTQGNFPCVLSY